MSKADDGFWTASIPGLQIEARDTDGEKARREVEQKARATMTAAESDETKFWTEYL